MQLRPHIAQIVLAVAALFCLALGLWFYFAEVDVNGIYAGVFTRVGAMLAVTCIAYPQLDVLKSRTSFTVIAVIFGLLLLVAIRPRLFLVGLVLAAAALLLNGVLRRLLNGIK